jgi:GNAT superfamily N-acetyltransferase
VRKQDEHASSISQHSFHLHIHERGSPQIKRHVNFRDYVINHPDAARAYAALKMKLAEKFTDNINAYVFGKDKLVQEIDTKAKLWPGRKKDYLPPNTGHPAKEWSQEKMAGDQFLTHEVRPKGEQPRMAASQKLIKAMEANLNVHMTHFAQYLNQVELIRIPGYTIVNAGLPDDTFNYVLDADFSNAEADKKIHEVTNYFLQKNIPFSLGSIHGSSPSGRASHDKRYCPIPFSWWISPYDKPENLSDCLENNGYVNTENNIAMYFDLDAWDENTFSIPELKIVQAKDEKSLIDFALILANDKTSFKKYFEWLASILTDDDPIEYYVGYVNNKPVVRGLSCYFAQVAGLHWLSTLPSERKKGYGKAMQEYRLKRAKDLGYHIAVLQASHEGYPLYKKLGYKECGVFREFKLLKSSEP